MFDLFDLFTGRFDRDFYESQKYKVYNKEDKDIIVVNAVGIDEEDVSLTLDNSNLILSAETENEELGITNKISNYKWILDTNAYSNIDYECRNGYIYIYLHKKLLKDQILLLKK